jgi:hypothetical protein
MLQVEIDQNLFDLQRLKLTFKRQNLYIFGISEQIAIRKSTKPVATRKSIDI